eukprot:6947317-Prymnesium_polylepis.1
MAASALLGTMDEVDFIRHSDDELRARDAEARERPPFCVRTTVTLSGAAALLLGTVAMAGRGGTSHLHTLSVSASDSMSGTCVQPGKFLSDCERLDAGSCGVACCVSEVAVPDLDPLDAYTALRDALGDGGPDGRYATTSTEEEDLLSEVPFAFSPPLPWRFTLSGKHSTDGAWASSGRWRDGFEDILRFAVGVATVSGDDALTRVRLHSMSGPGPVLVDYGQNFKTLALLCAHLKWPEPSPLYGCGMGQATGWRPANATTVALQNRDGVCLDAKQRGLNGGVVQMWACDPTNFNQLWNIDVASGLIKNRDGVCLSDASDRSQSGGAVV